MRELVESILTGNNVEAHRLFESRLNEIREKKLYEAKRNLAAQMNEVLGGKTRAQAEKEIRARGMTPRKASDVLPDPRDIKIPIRKKEDKKKKRVSEETLDELTAGDVAKGIGYAAGKTIKTAGDVGYRVKRTYRLLRMKRHQAQSQQPTSQFPASMHQTQTDSQKERPGRLQRNVNTLLGRKPGYVKPETPEDEKGGRAGKAVRMAGKGVGKAWGTWGNIVRSGMSGPLE